MADTGVKPKVSPSQRALNLWAVILIVWSIYRAYFKLPEWFDEFVAKPAVFILPVYWFIRHYEKKDFFKGIDLRFDKLKGDLQVGLGVGAIFGVSALLANFLKNGKLVFFQNNPDLTLQMVIFWIILSLATAVSEEVLSRGFVLKRLYDDSKNMLSAAFIASILFFFLHVPILFTNRAISGNLLIVFMVTDLILSLASSFIFLQRKSLIPAILIHAFYNIALLVFI